MKNVLLQGRRLTATLAVLCCLCILFTALPAAGAEYFVNKQGNDAGSGQGRDKAFLTIQ